MTIADRMANYRRATKPLPWDADKLPMIWGLTRQLERQLYKRQTYAPMCNSAGVRLLEWAILGTICELYALGAHGDVQRICARWRGE